MQAPPPPPRRSCGTELNVDGTNWYTHHSFVFLFLHGRGNVWQKQKQKPTCLRDKDPCALSDLIAEMVRRNPDITAFYVRPSGADYSSLLESLSTRLPSDHTRIHSHYMAAHPVDAEPPTTLCFASAKPKPATFSKEGWYKEAAKRKLFLFDPRQSGEETLPSTPSPVAQRGSGTATAPGSPCQVPMRPAGCLPSPSPPTRSLSRMTTPCWSCRVSAPLP